MSVMERDLDKANRDLKDERNYAYAILPEIQSHLLILIRSDVKRRNERLKKDIEKLEQSIDDKSREISVLQERTARATEKQKELKEVSLELRETRNKLEKFEQAEKERESHARTIRESLEFQRSEVQLRDKEIAALKMMNVNVRAQVEDAKQELSMVSTSVVTQMHALLSFFYTRLGLYKLSFSSNQF